MNFLTQIPWQEVKNYEYTPPENPFISSKSSPEINMAVVFPEGIYLVVSFIELTAKIYPKARE